MSVFVEPTFGASPLRRGKEFGRSAPYYDISRGPHLGFLESAVAAYDAQVKAESQRALESGFMDVEAEQIDRIRAAGMEPPESLATDVFKDAGFFDSPDPYDTYFDVAKYFTDGPGPALGGPVAGVPPSPEAASQERKLNWRDKKIQELRKARPDLHDLKTYRELWGETQKRAQRAESLWEGASTTPLGSVGGFLGGMWPIHPSVDPVRTEIAIGTGVNVPTAVGRMALQGVTGFGTELAVQPGIQERRRLLGLPYGPERIARAALMAGLGGVFFQGAGEAAGMAARRWFVHRPEVGDPAPPVPTPQQMAADLPDPRYLPRPDAYQPELDFGTPNLNGLWGKSRLGNLRAVQDFHAVQKQAEAWDGPALADIKPHTETPRDFTGPPLTQDEYARAIDPETFRVWDKLTTEAEGLRTNLRQADVSRAEARPEAAAARTIEEQARAIEERIAGTRSKKQVAKLQRELEELRTQRQQLLPEVAMPGVPDTYRDRLIRIDEEMRDLAPLVSRAQAIARGEWGDAAAARQAAYEAANVPSREPAQLIMYPLLRHTKSAPARPTKLPPRSATVESQIPMLNARPDIITKLPADADAADKIAAIQVADEKLNVEAVQRFREGLAGKVDEQALASTKGLEKRLQAQGLGGMNGVVRAALATDKTAIAAGRAAGKAAAKPPPPGQEDLIQINSAVSASPSKPPPGMVNVNGRLLGLDEKVISGTGFDADGEPIMISVKDLLDDLGDHEQALASMRTCSIG